MTGQPGSPEQLLALLTTKFSVFSRLIAVIHLILELVRPISFVVVVLIDVLRRNFLDGNQLGRRRRFQRKRNWF